MSDQNIEINIPDTGSIPPNPRTERIKKWINIVSTAGAIAIAIAAVIKPPDGGADEQLYKEMVKQLEILHKENVRKHQDIMSMRKYLDDYLRSSTIVGPHERGITQPNNPNAPVVLIPIDKSKIRVIPGSDTQPVLMLPAGEAPPLPDVHPMPDPLKIMEWKDLINQATNDKIVKERNKGK